MQSPIVEPLRQFVRTQHRIARNLRHLGIAIDMHQTITARCITIVTDGATTDDQEESAQVERDDSTTLEKPSDKTTATAKMAVGSSIASVEYMP